MRIEIDTRDTKVDTRRGYYGIAIKGKFELDADSGLICPDFARDRGFLSTGIWFRLQQHLMNDLGLDFIRGISDVLVTPSIKFVRFKVWVRVEKLGDLGRLAGIDLLPPEKVGQEIVLAGDRLKFARSGKVPTGV